MIEPVDGNRTFSDRLIDRLLGWWDVGGGCLIRAARGTASTCRTMVSAVTAPLMARPVVAKSVTTCRVALSSTRRWIGKAFSSNVPASSQRPANQPASVSTDKNKTKSIPSRSAAATKSTTTHIRTPLRSATADIRTPTRTSKLPTETRSGTGELRTHTRTGTGEIKPQTGAAITTASSTDLRATAMTTTLRCWSCFERNHVRTPRRGGCFLCTKCKTTMLVVDPNVGLTCDVGQAQIQGITLNRQADETDPG